MAMNRTAVIYTLGVVLFLSVIFFLALIKQQVEDTDDVDIYIIRAQTINNYITDFEQDINRVTYISGYRTFLAMEEYVSSSGVFFENASDAFLQIFFNGTFNGTFFGIMNDSTFSDYLTRFRLQGDYINVDMTANITNAYLYQNKPWSVIASIDLLIEFEDISQEVGWSFEQTYETEIPIYDIKDPLYSVYTYGLVSNVIVPTNVTVFITADNVTIGLQTHSNNSFYINSTLAPDIIMRFEGNLSASPYGIESLVNTPLLSSQGIPVDASSTIVDYLFFDNITHVGENIVNTPMWIRLDNAHLSYYDAVGKTT